MRHKAISLLLTLLLLGLFDGAFALACPAKSHCKSKAVHCPFKPAIDNCQFFDGDKSPLELSARTLLALPPSVVFVPPSFAAHSVLDTPDWHHASGLHLRLRVLRI
ncbi:MAG: hypothetical protein FJW30_03355 [Acidobacteria bacterium]|nr:hypothetical protein [Acidobacteriota bacterium]